MLQTKRGASSTFLTVDTRWPAAFWVSLTPVHTPTRVAGTAHTGTPRIHGFARQQQRQCYTPASTPTDHITQVCQDRQRDISNSSRCCGDWHHLAARLSHQHKRPCILGRGLKGAHLTADGHMQADASLDDNIAVHPHPHPHPHWPWASVIPAYGIAPPSSETRVTFGVKLPSRQTWSIDEVDKDQEIAMSLTNPPSVASGPGSSGRAQALKRSAHSALDGTCTSLPVCCLLCELSVHRIIPGVLSLLRFSICLCSHSLSEHPPCHASCPSPPPSTHSPADRI
ncbi:hypothetical protein LIA77_08007 [Sarocladium implicatum]|nr:hypothetical protein LIA77_08007 [Sarocladium implicatum]